VSEGLKFLACVLAEGSTSALRGVDAELFTEGAEQDCFEIVSDHLTQYGELPQIQTVETELQQQLPTRRESAPYHLTKMRERRLYNEARPLYGEIRQAIMDRNGDALRERAGLLHTLANTGHDAEQRIFNTAELYEDVVEEYQRLREHRDERLLGVPTGWQFVDNFTGGWQAGDIITLAARPEIGKTYILIHCAYSAWTQGRSVLFFTTEMPARQVGTRLLGYEAGVNPRLLRNATISRRAEERLDTATEGIHQDRGRFHVVEASGKPTSWVHGVINEYSPDLVCIDGCYLLQPSSGRRDAGRFERIGNVFDDLNTIKLDIDRPMLVTTQMNRAAGEKGKSGSLETMSYSDAIATHSSIILQIKDIPYGFTSTLSNWNPKAARQIVCLKGREGHIPTFYIRYEPPRLFTRISTDWITEPARQGRRADPLHWTANDGNRQQDR
jgi:hypothetical protein